MTVSKPEYSISQSQHSTFLLTTLTLPHTPPSEVLAKLTDPAAFFPLNPNFSPEGHNPTRLSASEAEAHRGGKSDGLEREGELWEAHETKAFEILGMEYNVLTRCVMGKVAIEIEGLHANTTRMGIEVDWECEAAVGKTSMRSVIFVEECMEEADQGGLRRLGSRIEEKFEVLKAPWGMTGTVLKRSSKERVTALERLVRLLDNREASMS
ncbi:hypothetical protein BJ508DRAFT_328512 [Ascobolus immersus RN42]|uniref:Uncharacterized protein n=1 Tax=Ascobolus immersus RN42 TaxID=1160509 RepID=A0A3N4I1G8_ASCIM|nr:hypothetical protein BJ508DRAFT_328512 [Ascobolus immersus RN42]